MLQRRARRVIRRTEQDRLGRRRNRPSHRIKIMNTAPAQWHRDRGCAGYCYRDRISLEAAPGVDHLIPRLAGSLQQVVKHSDRAGAESNLLSRHAKSPAERVCHLSVSKIGIAVHLRGNRRCSGLDDARKWGERVFIAGKLDRPLPIHSWGWLDRIARQSGNGRPNLDQIRTSPRGVLKIAAASPGRSRGGHQPISTSAKISLLRPPSHSSTRAGSPAISILRSSTWRPPADGCLTLLDQCTKKGNCGST